MRSDAASAKGRAGGWLPILLAVLSFHLGALLVHLAVPGLDRGNIGAAHRAFSSQADEIDVVFIGSSRFHAGIDVKAMEDELRKSGEELRVFNFGVKGMRTLEQSHVLRQVLAQRPERLRWVVLEALPVGITIRRNTDYSRKAEVTTARSISWHTTRVTLRALAAIWRFPVPFGERLELASHHLDLWARQVWNVGLLSERSFESSSGRAQRDRQEAGGPPVAESDADAVEEPGFGRVLGAGRKRKRSHGEVLRRWNEQTADQYEKRAVRIEAQNQLLVDFAELDLELIAERDRDARAAGVELIYLTMPCEVACPEILRLHEAGLLGRLLHFNDPERYPEFFVEAVREGLGHLNPVGARAFSRVVAREFLELRASE